MGTYFSMTGMPVFLNPDKTEVESLGPCCVCGYDGPGDRIIEGSAYLAPSDSDAWGCAICGIPMAGALLVLCPDCAKAQLEPRWVVKGRLLDRQRQPVSLLTILHVWHHDRHKHVEFATAFMALADEVSPTNGLPRNREEEKVWKTN